MKNKKRNLIIFSTFIILVVGIYLLIPKTKEEESNKTKPNVNTNGFLTLMLEQDDGTYKKTTSNTWPGDGYAFNNELSGCERGGELVYDRETNVVKLISSGSDKCYVYFDKYNVAKITNVTSTKTTNSVTLTVTTQAGENPIEKYYFSKDDGNSYEESSTSSYTFSGLNDNTTYKFKVYAKDTLGYETNETEITVTTDNLILLADYIKGLYTSQGTNGLYYHTSSLANSAEDNSYRYAGANPNNYVCFGSDAATCPNTNLYRIIGVFGSEVKLIKATSYGSYQWDSSSNTWSTSSIRTTLNSAYLSSLSNTWQSKITTHTWKVGGINSYSSMAKEVYSYEVGNNSNATTDSMKIGLMYVSDYGFAASNNYWTTTLSSYNSAKSSNWLYLGSTEWTITRYTITSNIAIPIDYSGYTGGIVMGVMNSFAVRPSFYLTSSTIYVSGSGTSSDPIRLS